MKNIHLTYTIIYSLLIGLLITSCSSDDDASPNDNSQQIALIETTAVSGTWRITNLNDSGQDETSDFAGYEFTFNSDGSLVAINGTVTMTGTWSITDDNNSDDDSSNDDGIEFNIFFPVPDTNDFEDLNDDWDIVSTSSTKIELIDISGGNGGTDLLTFEKN
jgi:hypothetical protein